MSDGDAVIVGAGPAGLAVAATLGRAGLHPVVLEREGSVASAWRGRYEGLRLNTSTWFSYLPGHRTGACWPPRASVSVCRIRRRTSEPEH